MLLPAVKTEIEETLPIPLHITCFRVTPLMLAILQMSCNLYLVPVTNIIPYCCIQSQFWNKSEAPALLRYYLHGLRSVVLNKIAEAHRWGSKFAAYGPMLLVFQAWDWQFFWDCSSQMSPLYCSPIVPRARSVLTGSSGSPAAAGRKLFKHSSRWKAISISDSCGLNLVFCYRTWQWKKKKAAS